MLVIMAARAAHTDAHDTTADHSDLIRHHVHLKVVVHRFGRLGSYRKEPSGNDLPVMLLR
jgi:hypothetical protein